VATAVALGAAALLLPAVASATPDTPASPPTVTSVQQRLGALAQKNTQLVEKYNQAQVEVAEKQKAADAAVRRAQAAKSAFEQGRAAMGASVAAQYEGGTFSATGALLSSASGQSYLDQLNTLGIISAHTAQIVEHLGEAKTAAAAAEKQAAALLKQATATRDALAKQKVSVQGEVDKYTTLLASLNAAQRAAYQRTIVPQVAPAAVTAAKTIVQSAPASSAAAQAVKFALAQVGKPYVFGAAGPDAYDCSGLTMAAWNAGGVALPHSAADQYNYGTHVSIDSLKPGDLVFFYQPIGHVTIYIGNGLMVSAPQSGENVSVVPLDSFSGSITGATRLVS
jgi:peptidoglycan DL-endopeptidase CwlO